MKSVDAVSSELERPVFVPERRTGTWTQTTPAHTLTDVVYESTNGMKPLWVDVVTRLSVTVLLSVDPGAIDNVTVESIDDFTTLAEFKAKLRYFDLDQYMAEHEISTVEELKEHAVHLLAEVRLKTPAAFDAEERPRERAAVRAGARDPDPGHGRRRRGAARCQAHRRAARALAGLPARGRGGGGEDAARAGVDLP